MIYDVLAMRLCWQTVQILDGALKIVVTQKMSGLYVALVQVVSP